MSGQRKGREVTIIGIQKIGEIECNGGWDELRKNYYRTAERCYVRDETEGNEILPEYRTHVGQKGMKEI